MAANQAMAGKRFMKKDLGRPRARVNDLGNGVLRPDVAKSGRDVGRRTSSP
jgi:hypothetical protein